MPVIINEFEVVAAPPTESQSGATESAPAASAPTPHDLEYIAQRQAERLARVWAH